MLNEKGETSSFIANGEWALLGEFLLELETKVREDFTITKKAFCLCDCETSNFPEICFQL